MNIDYQSAKALHSLLAKKEISSLELVDMTISRIERLDSSINAVVIRDFERARSAAKDADVAIAKGENHPLLGIPMTVKESFNVAGLTTSWGNPDFKNWIPTEDALVISRLKAAGAIILGKTNVPFMLSEWQAYNEIYGVTNNPWNLDLTPGGSSGGSAAALAAGFTAIELGSDLAGSLRVPANFCGVLAHKPSHDLVPLRGAGPPMSPALPRRVEFAVAGPMARTVDDLILTLDVIAGPDEWQEGRGYQLALPPSRHNKLQQFKVLVIDEHPLYPTSTVINKALHHFTEDLQKLGVQVAYHSSKIPDLARLAHHYGAMLWARSSGKLPLNVYENLQHLAESLPSNMSDLMANCIRGAVLSHRDWLNIVTERELMQAQWSNLMKEFDVVLCPVMPTVAFPHYHTMKIDYYDQRTIKIDGTDQPYSEQFIWSSIATFLNLPATAIPIGLTQNNLPLGIQIMGGYLEDKTTLTFAKLVESEFGALDYTLL